MTATAEPDLRYPIGRPERAASLAPDRRAAAIQAIADAPARLRAAVDGLTDAQLDTPYRPGGWTVRQLVHHVADSHMNAYTRFKLAVTESNPTIKPYDEAAWASLTDSSLPIAPSLAIVDAVHQRLDVLLRSLPDDAFARTLVHPENGPMTVDSLLAVYSWHGAHHTAHVTALRDREGWR